MWGGVGMCFAHGNKGLTFPPPPCRCYINIFHESKHPYAVLITVWKSQGAGDFI